MTTCDKTWETTRDNYLRQVAEALKAAKYPSNKSIVEEVRSHLERRYAELAPEKRTWESYQAIIKDMGPPSDYAELLGLAKLKRRLVSWRRVAILVPLALLVLMVGNFFGVIRLTFYHGPRVFYASGEPEQPAFVADAQLVGKWVTVDFVDKPSDFTPGKKSVAARGLWVTSLDILEGGRIAGSVDRGSSHFVDRCRWTKGWILDNENQVHAQYVVKVIGGQQYLFYPWMSGDIMYRWMRPPFYVLKKVGDAESQGAPAGQ
jgi:hypothetical protein